MRATARGKTKPAVSLSEREVNVLLLTSFGLSSAEVANLLDIEPETVNNHKSRVRKKYLAANIDPGNGTGVVCRALREGAFAHHPTDLPRWCMEFPSNPTPEVLVRRSKILDRRGHHDEALRHLNRAALEGHVDALRQMANLLARRAPVQETFPHAVPIREAVRKIAALWADRDHHEASRWYSHARHASKSVLFSDLRELGPDQLRSSALRSAGTRPGLDEPLEVLLRAAELEERTQDSA